MPKPAKFDKGKRIPKKEYKKKLDEYYEKRHPDFYDNKAFLKNFGSKCLDKNLFKKIKNQAKNKFKPYPSNYASVWIKNQYKRRGGKLRGKEQDITDKEKETLSNLRTAVLNTAKEETNERKIVERRGDAKEGDLWVHPNTGNLKMKVGDKWVTVNDPNELPKINKQKVKKDLSVAFAEKRKQENIKPKEVIIEEKPKISRGQFLYKYKSPQNFYSWQDLAREHIKCPHRSKQHIYKAPAYYLKDDLCNSLINTNIDNLSFTEKPNIVNPNFFLLNSTNINNIKYSYIECYSWTEKDHKELLVNPKYRFDVYVNFVIEPNKIYYYGFNWNNLKIFKILQFKEV